MKSTLTQKEHSQVLVTLVITDSDLEPYKEKTTQALAKHVNVPGFRPGTAPSFAIISHIGAESFKQELIDQALPHLYYQAVLEHKLEPVAAPRMNLVSRDPLTFEALVALMPEVKIKNIEAMKQKHEPIAVSDKEMEEVLHEMRKSQATFKPLEGAVEKGDKIEINFKGFDEGGAPLDNTDSKNHPLFVGENSLIPGFEDNLIGMKVGESKKFPITFPADYHHAPFKSKKVHFEVEVVKGEKTVLPEFDEGLVEKIMGKKETVENFKKLVKEDVEMRKKMELRKGREAKLMESMIENAEVDIPPVLIDEEVEYMIQDLKERFEKQSGNAGGFEKFLASIKEKGKDPTERYREEATGRVKLRLVISKLFKEVKVEVSDEDMEKAGKGLLAQAPESERAMVEKQLKDKKGIYERLKNNLMLEKLLTHFIGE